MYGYVKHLIWGAALLGLAPLGVPSQAQGAIIPTLVAGSPSGPGPFTFTYEATLFNDQRVVNGDFFVIYDFEGFVPGSAFAPTGWAFSSALLSTVGGGTIPPALGTDNPGSVNLVFTRNGGDITPVGNNNVILGNFGAESTLGGSTSGVSGAEATNNPGPGDAVNFAGTDVPSATPEPATWILLGVALPLLGGIPLLRRMRRGAATDPADAI